MDPRKVPESVHAAKNDLNAEVSRLRLALANSYSQEENETDWKAVGDLCARLGDILENADRLPESIQAYQEATDAFGKLSDSSGKAEYYARKVVSGVTELWKRPSERLNLLVVKLENEQRHLTAASAAPNEIAEVGIKIATILHRRDRFHEAATKYLEAISLLRTSEAAEFRLAEMELRLAGLYQYELNDPRRSIEHYRKALELFAKFEPISEGEQMNRKLCEDLLAQAEFAAKDQLS
jgi:tetratricopeptide (TPR) repeat protein